MCARQPTWHGAALRAVPHAAATHTFFNISVCGLMEGLSCALHAFSVWATARRRGHSVLRMMWSGRGGETALRCRSRRALARWQQGALSERLPKVDKRLRAVWAAPQGAQYFRVCLTHSH